MPTQFDLILFDADGTLLDFAASERLAFAACLGAHVEPARLDEVYREYTQVGIPLWKALEEGALTLLELRDRRWAELSRRCALNYAVADLSLAYVAELKRHAHLIDGAVEVCQALAERHQLGVVTNGFEEVQVARFATSALGSHIDFLVTSETAGAHKPARAIFERALELAGRPLLPERVLMVGDSFATDIVGGQRMGFSTCWFNPRRVPAPSSPGADLEISELRELLTRLEPERSKPATAR